MRQMLLHAVIWTLFHLTLIQSFSVMCLKTVIVTCVQSDFESLFGDCFLTQNFLTQFFEFFNTKFVNNTKCFL